MIAAAYDPAIDAAHGPATGASVALGVQRFQDDFGLVLRVATPRFLDEHLAIALSGGIGFYPDLRSLPMTVEDQEYSSWSLYGHARLCLEAAAPIAFSSGRIYAAIGPSFLLLSEQLSSKRIAPGVYGAAGVELFVGTDLHAELFSFYFEIGAVAHDAAADIANRMGAPMMTEATVDRSIATGLAIGGGIRFYFWR